jgi:hypothetical protein
VNPRSNRLVATETQRLDTAKRAGEQTPSGASHCARLTSNVALLEAAS